MARKGKLTKKQVADRLTNAAMKLEMAGWFDAPKKVKESYRRAAALATKRLSTTELNKALKKGRDLAKGR